MKKIIILVSVLLLAIAVIPRYSQAVVTYSYLEHVLEDVNYLILQNSQGLLSTVNNGDSLYTVIVDRYDPYTRVAVASDSVNISLKELVVMKNKLTADLVIINQAINFLRTK